MNKVVIFDDDTVVSFDDPIEDEKHDHVEQNEPLSDPDSDLMLLTNQLNA